jgi:uncharacterized protein YkwD
MPSHSPRSYIRRGVTVALTSLIAAGTVGTATAAAKSHGPRAHIATPSRVCADENASVASSSAKQMRNAVVCLVNQERVKRGLSALRASKKLDASAQGWTNHMVSSDSFTHGLDFSARISAAGFAWTAAGENIAAGYTTPKAVVEAWMASPGHRANILSRAYTRVGTGVSAHGVIGATGATWVQDFARPRG